MFFIPDPKMFVNKFVETILPTKSQIFSRTGMRAVTPNGVFTGDDSVKLNHSMTQQADDFASAAESFEVPKSEE